jgi:hypothetical protein
MAIEKLLLGAHAHTHEEGVEVAVFPGMRCMNGGYTDHGVCTEPKRDSGG